MPRATHLPARLR